MVDLAHNLLQEKGEPMSYRDLAAEVGKLKGFTEEEIMQYIAQFYTDINIDGRFVCVGKGQWGLKDWYPTEQLSDAALAAQIKDDDFLDDEELDETLYEDEEAEESFDEELLDLDDLGDTFDEESPFGELEDEELVDEDEEGENL
jgi:DNA-directed RNA polymerase subunit delta